MENEKKIEISGTNNRYLINKLKKQNKEVKTRKVAEKMGLPTESFLLKNQINTINNLYNNIDFLEKPHIISQLESKISGYKQQDLIKKRYIDTKFIKLSEVINALHGCSLLCHYCKDETYILYDLNREMKQWTLDRINNEEGHNTDNVIISCLECNLKRRRTNSEAFLFTKQLNIVKS
jgi:hypothetical protein